MIGKTVMGGLGACGLLATAMPASAAPAPGSRIVQCEVYSKGPGFEGPCRFTPGRGGSFTLSRDAGDLIPQTAIRQVRVEVLARNRARIHGLGAPGRPDPAVRDAADPACWVSNPGNVTVCAR